MNIVSYWLWPNPAGWHYNDPKVMAILGACLALVILSFAVGFWRKTLKNPVTKNLSATWGSALFWFGLTAAFFVVCRVETIQFLSMRALWLVWAFFAALYVLFQILNFRRRHYTVLERTKVVDERDKYLPKRKN